MKESYREMIELIKEGELVGAEIARRTGYSRERVRQIAKKLGIKLPSVRGIEYSIKCKRCQKVKVVTLGEVRWKKYYQKGYCSKECYSEGEIYQELVCVCGKVFKRRKRLIEFLKGRIGYRRFYCSKECARKYKWGKKK